MRVCSLFAGIGGFDLAAEWMGWETCLQVELDEWCQKVLAKNFPAAERHGDIKTFDGTKYKNKIDLICGGFPCQPYSQAGKRLGKADERHLWPEMLRVIREIKPRWVVGENVRGLLTWNDGLVFDEICADLEAEGYEVQAFVLPAVAVNAPHRRDRLWIVAYANNRSGQSGNESTGRAARTNADRSGKGANVANGSGEYDGRCFRRQAERQVQQPGKGAQQGAPANANSNGYGSNNRAQQVRCSPCQGKGVQNKWQWVRSNTWGIGTEEFNTDTTGSGRTQAHRPRKSELNNQSSPGIDWSDWPTQPPLCPRNDGISAGLDRSASWRSNAIKASGNAVVPQVVLQIFRTIQQYEDSLMVV
ncbi:DNA cytosine methyltransferase [Tellurirhabdus bombi]|uniref:DNA cytosine methyltransferase n=1 Tax=Tellurirhabdus bombi TaxID=2907205 RepID=UPI00387F4F73